MLEVEAALARVEASAGMISVADAAAVERACAALELDVESILVEAANTGTPVVPLVTRLRAAGADRAHRGATSQDIVDTATMLVVRESLDIVLENVGAASESCARLAREHRGTLMVGRTLLQAAVPTTLGLKAAGWMNGLDEAAGGLVEVRTHRLAVQLGGAAGTLAAFGDHGPAVVHALAAELGLAEPVVPWHTQRTRIGELAGALGVTAGAVAKPARDVVLLAQSEVGEVREGVSGRGGSSTLPHKQNPVAAVSALAAAQQAPGLVATLLGSMPQEHERAAGAWQAEWPALRTLLICVGTAARWLADSLGNLVIDTAAMAANVEKAGPSLVSESGGAVSDPRDYLGSAGLLVDRALAAHAAR
jgi:3-carboxy-cis,cis-muconate cycloisomerase